LASGLIKKKLGGDKGGGGTGGLHAYGKRSEKWAEKKSCARHIFQPEVGNIGVGRRTTRGGWTKPKLWEGLRPPKGVQARR